jgi:uncharacterized membrane protein
MSTISVFHKHRLEALSDGLFAIAMTLLVLDLKVPQVHTSRELASALGAQTWAYFGFALTFSIAAVYWRLQHRLFDCIETIGAEAMVPTFVFLAFISLLPFTTALISENGDAALSFVLYFGNLAIAAGALVAKLELAIAHKHTIAGANLQELRSRLLRNFFVMLAGALGAAFLSRRYMWCAPVGAAVVLRLAKYLLRHTRERRKASRTPAVR